MLRHSQEPLSEDNPFFDKLGDFYKLNERGLEEFEVMKSALKLSWDLNRMFLEKDIIQMSKRWVNWKTKIIEAELLQHQQANKLAKIPDFDTEVCIREMLNTLHEKKNGPQREHN